jgi:hypothetical protein
MRMNDDDEKDVAPTLPVSPNTGLDPEIRQFFSRVMAGYEAAHRTIADMAEQASKSTAELHKAVTSAIQMQMKAAEEREALISKRHKRDLEDAAAQEAQANRAAVMRDARTVLLLAGKKYLGVPLTGNDSHGLQDLLATMTPDQVDAAMTSGTIQLSDAQRHLLMSTLASLGDAEKALEAPKPEAAE